MSAKRKAKKDRHLVAAMVSVPSARLVPAMYRMAAKKAFLHMWGDAKPPKTATIVIMVEGKDGPVDDIFPPIIRCTCADVERLIAAYQEAEKDPSKESNDSGGGAMLLAIGTSVFCQTVTRFWAADRNGLAGWGERMLNHLNDAPPCTFVWMDGKDSEVRKISIDDLADAEEAAG